MVGYGGGRGGGPRSKVSARDDGRRGRGGRERRGADEGKGGEGS